MIHFDMNYRLIQPFGPAPPRNPFLFCSSAATLKQLLSNQHLPTLFVTADSRELMHTPGSPQLPSNQQIPKALATADSKGVITHAESAVAKLPPASRLESAVTKKWGIPSPHPVLFREGGGVDAGDELQCVLVVDLFQDFVVEPEAVDAPEGVALAVILDVLVACFEAAEIPLVFVHFVDVLSHEDAILILRQKIVGGIRLAAEFGKYGGDVHVDVGMLVEKFAEARKIVAVKAEMRRDEFRARMHGEKVIALGHERFKRRIFRGWTGTLGKLF